MVKFLFLIKLLVYHQVIIKKLGFFSLRMMYRQHHCLSMPKLPSWAQGSKGGLGFTL